MCGALRALHRRYPFSRLRRGESRGQVDDVADVMRRIYASGVRATDTYSFPFLDVDPVGSRSGSQPAFPRPRRGRALVRIHICTSRRVAVNDTGRNFATMSTLNAPATFFPAEFPYGFHAIPFAEDRAPKTSASNARQGSHDRGSIDSDSRPQNCRRFVARY